MLADCEYCNKEMEETFVCKWCEKFSCCCGGDEYQCKEASA